MLITKINNNAIVTNEYSNNKLEVTDESDGCGAKFSVLIVSDKFNGKPLLARHRLVNSVLQEELKSIHAFTQKPLTVEQWKAK
ncbi:hypothetical protein K1T71_011495 [Dendrolimus kikuchii]|uniref:Uncharacterized protein n=1 Tax=Dendrolimus kikuchii TaxID=765133 RepID=A0ACC1CPI7_9NEOP|nr:hypothetical protein K1T71_011495 [Dendrolimus kikuchii]